MRKLLISLLAVSSTAAFAFTNNNSQFQEFDNEVNIGWGMNQTTSTPLSSPIKTTDDVVSTGNTLNLEAERLFNNGIWINANANLQFAAGPATTPYSSPSYGLNTKAGYAFALLGQHLLLTPYALLGLNNNAETLMNQTAILTAHQAGAISNDFVYTGGFGGRVDYRINHVIDIYADQNAAYNWDQSVVPHGAAPQNFASYTSTLGAKFNLAPSFQLGIRGFYTAYSNNSSNLVVQDSLYASQNSSGFGGLVSLGLTY